MVMRRSCQLGLTRWASPPAGLIADRFGFAAAIIAIGVLTFLSGTVYFVLARDTNGNS